MIRREPRQAPGAANDQGFCIIITEADLYATVCRIMRGGEPATPEEAVAMAAYLKLHFEDDP